MDNRWWTAAAAACGLVYCAPAQGCGPASAGQETKVPYSADYWFYD